MQKMTFKPILNMINSQAISTYGLLYYIAAIDLLGLSDKETKYKLNSYFLSMLWIQYILNCILSYKRMHISIEYKRIQYSLNCIHVYNHCLDDMGNYIFIIACQSIYYSISNCNCFFQLLYSKGNAIASCMLYVNCYNPIEAIAIELQLKKTQWPTVPRRSPTGAKVPPLQFFYKNQF